MAGITGVIAFDKVWNVSKFIYYSLLALRHRGQDQFAFFICGDECKVKVVEELRDLKVEELNGWIGVGFTGTENRTIREGNHFLAYDGEVKDEVRLIRKLKEIDDKAKAFEGEGVFSAIYTNSREIFAYRDPSGNKPLFLGGFGFDLGIVSSEPSGIEVIGGEVGREVESGELIRINQYGVFKQKTGDGDRFLCSLEFIYLQRIDSHFSGKQIYDVRERIGRQLAIERKIEGDVVIGVPETAIPFAIGYSKETKIPYSLGFTRTGDSKRTMIMNDAFERLIGVQLKLNPIKSVVCDKRVIVIDDSMVTGNTLKNTVFLLRKNGAKEVHVLIASPKLTSLCPYGVRVPPKEELIAANLSDEEIAITIGADSIYWLSFEGMYKAIGLNPENLCIGCFTGKYKKVIK